MPTPVRALALALSLALLPGLAVAEAPPPASAPLIAAADDITRQVVALRGLPLLRPFAKGVLNREQIGARMKERIAKEYSADEVNVESRILKRLGLLPVDADYQKLITDLLMDQVAGFYDPFARQLYVADWLGTDLQRPAMAHEIEHALQDQHFDLKAFATPLKDEGDKQLARSALVEGDGTAVMLEFVVQGMGIDIARLPDAMGAISDQLLAQMSSTPSLANAPRFLRDTLTFPYFAGMKFVMTLRRDKPWSRIDEVFRRPPESTEQILHPQKYVARELPVPVVAAPITALSPARQVRHDVFGEFEWRVILSSRLDDAVAERAAEGWGGDRMAAYADGDGPLSIVNLSTWDSDLDAIQLESAVRQLMARTTEKPVPAADRPAVFEKGAESWSVERRGARVLSLFGVPTAKRAAVAEEVWRSWKVGGASRATPPSPR